MVEDRITDGRRIGQLLASEIEGRTGPLAGLSVTDADPAADPSPEGTKAYEIAASGERFATALLLPDRLLLSVEADPGRALETAREAGLRARPKATDPPRTLVFVESGAETKRAADVLATLAESDGEE